MKPAPRPARPGFPWLPLILLVITIGVFWVLPRDWGKRPIQVDFETPGQP